MNAEYTGKQIARLRKELGLTQKQLAEQLCVTDKAVSKWERDLSCPDVQLLPKLAQLLGITLDELLQAQPAPRQPEQKQPAPAAKAKEPASRAAKNTPRPEEKERGQISVWDILEKP